MPVAAILALVAAHAFDFVSFQFMVSRHGLEAEFNPLVVALAQSFGLPGLTLAKIASVALVASTFVVIVPQRRRLATFIILVGIGAGLVGGISNVAST